MATVVELALDKRFVKRHHGEFFLGFKSTEYPGCLASGPTHNSIEVGLKGSIIGHGNPSLSTEGFSSMMVPDLNMYSGDVEL